MDTQSLQAEIDRLKLRYTEALLEDPESIDTQILQIALMDVIMIDLSGKEAAPYPPEDWR